MARRSRIYLDSDSIIKSFREQFEREVPEAMMTVLGPPPVRGVGRAGGFKYMVEDRGDNGPTVLQEMTENLDQAKAGQDRDDPKVATWTSWAEAETTELAKASRRSQG